MPPKAMRNETIGGYTAVVGLCVAAVLAVAGVSTPRLIRTRSADAGIVVDYGVWTTVAAVTDAHGHHAEGSWSSCEFVRAAGARVHVAPATTTTATTTSSKQVATSTPTHRHAVAPGLSPENVTDIVNRVLKLDTHEHEESDCVFCWRFMPASHDPYRGHTHAARARRGVGVGHGHVEVGGTLNVTARCAHVLVGRCRVSQAVSLLGVVLAAAAAAGVAAGCARAAGGLGVATLAQMSAGFLWSTCLLVDGMLVGSFVGGGCGLDAEGGDPTVSDAYVMLWVSAVVAQLAACWLAWGACCTVSKKNP